MKIECSKEAFLNKSGVAQETNPVIKNGHSREFLSVISTPFNNQKGGDPRLQASVMTSNVMGFTLIELLVVVLIIGILAAVALPQYQRAVQKARIAQILPLMKAIKNANTLLYLQKGAYSADPADWDLTLPSEITRVTINSSATLSQLSFADGSRLEVVSAPMDGAAEERIYFSSPKISVGIWLSIPNDKWMCYPLGTPEGVKLCKNLGCPESITTGTTYCIFSF